MPFDAAPPHSRTLADVIAAIEVDTTLTEVQRRDYASAVRCISGALGQEPAALPAELNRLRPMINAMSPHRLGIAPKTLANWRSNFLKAMNQYGGAKQQRVPLTPEWSALRGLIADRAMSAGLSRFMQFCSARCVAPEDVDDQVVAAFVETLKADTLVRKPNQVHRRTCQLWRDAVNIVPGWPQHMLALPDHRKPRTSYPLSMFAESFQRDVEAYVDRPAPESPFENGALRPWKPGTIRQCRRNLQLAASALTHRGAPIESIMDLKVLVAPANVEQILRFYYEKNGRAWTTFTRSLHQCLTSVAHHWVKASSADLDRLRELRKAFGRDRIGLTSKNVNTLRQFYVPENQKRLYRLPGKLAALARSGRYSPERAAVMMQKAVAIEILLHAPIRMNNLIHIEIGRQLMRPGIDAGPYCLVFTEDETKNAEPLEHELPPTALVAEYVSHYQPLLGKGSAFLFPSLKRARKGQETLASQISKTVVEHTGLTMTPHQFRHLAAAMMLDQYPGALHLVQRMLGHKSPKTTLRFYAGLNPRSAARLMGELVSKFRGD